MESFFLGTSLIQAMGNQPSAASKGETQNFLSTGPTGKTNSHRPLGGMNDFNVARPHWRRGQEGGKRTDQWSTVFTAACMGVHGKG